MKELICFLMSSATPIISQFEQFTLSCQSGFFINVVDFICILPIFLVLALSVFTTKKLLIYLPVACFNKSKIIIKDIVLFLIYSGFVFLYIFHLMDFLLFYF